MTLLSSYQSIIILCGISSALPLIYLFFMMRRGNRFANLMIASLLINCCALGMFSLLRIEMNTLWSPQFGALFGFQLLIGPLFYIYMRALTEPQCYWRIGLWWHFLPALFGIVLWLAQLPLTESDWLVRACQQDQLCDIQARGRFVHRLAASISVGTYTLVVLMKLRIHRQNIETTYSSIEEVTLNWLSFMAYFLLVGVILHFFTELQGFFGFEPVLSPTLGVSLLPLSLTVMMGVFGVKQRSILFSVNTESETQPTKPNAKYQTSSLTEEGAAELWKKLLQYMITSRPFLSNELKVSQLADQLQVSVNHLSETINGHSGQSFYEFINSYRITESTKLLARKDMQSLSISEIAYRSGFNSSSTFSAHFKKRMTQTPSQFRKKYK